MKRLMIAAGIVSMMLAASGAARADGAVDDKKISVGGDVQLVIPFSDMANATGPQIGAVVRGGYRVIPPLEITGRIGYLAGLSKSQGTIDGVSYSTSISNVPLWLGARYFFMNAPAGLYGAAELAANFMTASASAGGTSHGTGLTRGGFNLGAGYVFSQDLPIDVRVQLSDFNLVGASSGEKTLLGIGVSAGYSFFF